jgi:hypothetical protein
VFKRVWIENDPDFAVERGRAMAEFNEYAKPFTHRLPFNRFERNKHGKKQHSSLWRYAMFQALKEVDAEYIHINGGIWFKTQEHFERVRDLAERTMREGYQGLRDRYPQPPREDRLAALYQVKIRGKQTTVEAEREKARLTGKDCPDCGYPMRTRTARKGANAGQRFLGCSLYPTCKGTRPSPITTV